jgi:hypothetical protein
VSLVCVELNLPTIGFRLLRLVYDELRKLAAQVMCWPGWRRLQKACGEFTLKSI